MDAEKLIEEGARMVERATYDAFLFGDTSYRRAAKALGAMMIKAAAEEIESQLRTAPQCEICGARIVNGKRLRTLAEQVEKAND